ncbi:MAG: sigma-54-dependent Fis family transcriptional regulator [Candidatus Omnitrophica bacterium]|nr:sigma-54-dependent Fis family transcriptional regulator [Candidatus Omnitrophota bacterium]
MVKTKKMPIILVVDDDLGVLSTLEIILEKQFEILTAKTGKEALDQIAEKLISIIFLDIQMPDIDGMEILRRIKKDQKNISVIIATATNSAKKAVEAMQLGACNYITKPFDVDEVLLVAQKALEIKLLKEVVCFRPHREESKFDSIIGRSKEMIDLYRMIEKVANNDSTIFVSGESGTGKELITRAIHFNSNRKNKPFIPINCGSIPEKLLESELFGHERGAFTDAINQKLGMFELANEGTIFLDEISSLKLNVQANLLRVLEEREIKRLGGTKIIKVDVRIICATNIDLKCAIQEGKFRQDLYYRLNVVPLHLPPLRERRDDIPLLIEHFLKVYNQSFQKKIKGVTNEVLEYLINYDWPGNVRELRNIMERLVALKDDDVIVSKDLPFEIYVTNKFKKVFQIKGALKNVCREFEKGYIESVLEKTGGNQTKAAKILDIHRNALFSKMKNLGVKK